MSPVLSTAVTLQTSVGCSEKLRPRPQNAVADAQSCKAAGFSFQLETGGKIIGLGDGAGLCRRKRTF